MSDLLPAVLLNALRRYKFDGFPLWRIADEIDHVKLEVTFRKTTPTLRQEGVGSRRRPLPPTPLHPPPTPYPPPPHTHTHTHAGEWPYQTKAARRRPLERPTTIRRPMPFVEMETPPPLTLQDSTRSTITHVRKQKTASKESAQIITRPTTPPPIPDSQPKMKSRISPDRGNTEPSKDYDFIPIKDPNWYPLHVKYDVHGVRECNFTSFIFRAQSKNRRNSIINVELPVHFMFHINHHRCVFMKGPASKFYVDKWYDATEKK